MRRLLLLISCCWIAAHSFAQVGELRNEVAIGFNGGYNLSSVDFSPTIKQGLQPGYTGGFTLRYTTEKYFSLICAAQLECNFAQRGWNEMIDDGSITMVASEDEAIAAVNALCDFYNVKYMMAYNSAFDFCKTKCNALIAEREFIDIYLMALQTITHLKKYAKFCRENNFKSRSGKSVATTAESIYAYLTNNVNYSEEHTALEDSKIEMEIFLACLKMHKRFTKNLHQRDCKENKCFPAWNI